VGVGDFFLYGARFEAHLPISSMLSLLTLFLLLRIQITG
jgi:hypothetical protein